MADQFMGLSSGLRQSYSGICGDLVSGEAILLEIQNTYLREDEKPVVWMKLKMQNPAGPVIEIYRPVSWKNFQDFQAGKLIKVTFDSGDIPGTLSVIAAPDSRDANLDMI
ncbi:MAG: hypothetical protein IT569_00385 [Leptospiraceae bacterium]|nr:hypothetical protein [Leptospiraceae bacterium]